MEKLKSEGGGGRRGAGEVIGVPSLHLHRQGRHMWLKSWGPLWVGGLAGPGRAGEASHRPGEMELGGQSGTERQRDGALGQRWRLRDEAGRHTEMETLGWEWRLVEADRETVMQGQTLGGDTRHECCRG